MTASKANITRRGALFSASAFASRLTAWNRPVDPAAQLRECAQQFHRVFRVEDELYDYGRSSLEILERLLAALSLSTSHPFAKLYRQVLAREFDDLSRFLREEIEINRRRRVEPRRQILVREAGLRGDARSDNRPALAALLDEIRNSRSRWDILFPPGIYRFSAAAPTAQAGPAAALLLKNLQGVRLIGEGSVRIVVDGHHTPSSLRLEGCRDVEIRNLTLEMEPPPFTAGVVRQAYPQQNEFELDLLPGARAAHDAVFVSSQLLRGKLHNPETGEIDRSGGDPRVVSVRPLGNGLYRLKVARSDLSDPPGLTAAFRPGQLFSLHARSDRGRGNGIEIWDSAHILLRGLTLHGAAGHAVLVVGSAGVQFLDCTIQPAPGRIAVNTADGFHVRGNRKGPYLERCWVEKTNDDCMNFYSRASAVLSQQNEVALLIPAADARNWRPGDLVALLDANTGAVDSLHTVAAMRPATWRDQAAVEVRFQEPFPRRVHSRESTGRGAVSTREYTPSGGEVYRRAMALAAPFEHMAANLSLKNDGFLIRNCQMGNNRGSSFKCKASNGIIENCRLVNPSMDNGILFRIELDWREAFYPHQVLVRSCRLGGRRPVVTGAGLPGERKLTAAELPWIRDIELENCWDEFGLRPVRLGA
ncbi:MAG: hypothetical protein NZV14_03740 [Bryobacteraceae bacterium]|nr:hypothetical protein [Bryobacteraceae bacterium]MDW8377244.1 hypothetical protein [Bryobacterales bacterium]